MELKDSLRRFRKTYKLTQVQAAEAAGVRESMYQLYEYGKSEPKISVMVALADAYNVSVDYILGRTDNPDINR